MSAAPRIAPPLDTERLTLRAHRREDLAELTALWGDPVVTRYIGGKPNTPEEVWAKLLRMVGHWALVGYGYWVVREKGSDRFVGEVGFGDFRREMDPPFGDMPEGGWVLSPAVYGQGYASEAVGAALSWLDEVHAPAATACMIDAGNTASARVADKCGYRLWTPTTYKGESVLLFRRLAPGAAG
ncbi:MAG: GNAT family N-acetyltransferase [Polyangiaceae bacterium]